MIPPHPPCTVFVLPATSPYFFFFFLINLFIYLWLRWVFVAVHRLSLVAASRGYSPLQCTGFSLRGLLLLRSTGPPLRWLLLLRSTGSRHAGLSNCGLRALERRLSSCGTRAQLLRGMWDLPGPGLKPVSPALAGGLLTTAPSGKPILISFSAAKQDSLFIKTFVYYLKGRTWYP